MKTLIVIPARYGSTRFPGKPLVLIAGKPMLARVIDIAKAVAEKHAHTEYCVATDDERIGAVCDTWGVRWVMTPADCPTGSDRLYAAVQRLGVEPELVMNLQGDAPLTPPVVLDALMTSFRVSPCEVVTPVVRLAWSELDELRESKTRTPFTGTTAVFDEATGRALWFSKQVLPAIRNESALRAANARSPVYRHLGVYGFSRTALQRFVDLPMGHFEQLEGLEQLRLLEHGIPIRCVPIDLNEVSCMSGIDSPEDIHQAERLLAQREGHT